MAAFTAADGVVYAGSKTGRVYAFDVHCRADGGVCGPAWTAQVPHGTGLPVVAGGLLLTQGRDGTFAYAVGCGTGGATCSPLWHIPQTGIRVQDGVLYTTNRFAATSQPDRAYAFDARTGEVLWWSKPIMCCSNDPTPVRYGDSVYVNFGSVLEVFPANCRGLCDPTWTAPIIDRFSTQPVVVGDTVAVAVATDGSTGGVLSWTVDCETGGRSCAEQHRASGFPELTSVGPQAYGDRLYTESLRGTGTYVFDFSCLARRSFCHSVWADASAISPWETVVSGGVVFQADQAGWLKAFDAACPTSFCPVLWQSDQTPINRAVINGGEVLMSSIDHKIYAFAPGSARTPPSKNRAAVFYGAVALGAGALLIVRRRRRRAI